MYESENTEGLPAEKWPDDIVAQQARLITEMFGQAPPQNLLFNTEGAASYFYRVIAEAERRGLAFRPETPPES